MANRGTIQPTKFENVRTGHIDFGVRVYDDEGQTYDNTWDSIPDDDLEVLELVLKSKDDTIVGILGFIQEYEKGIYIGEVWYTWDQIKHLFKE
jgi:hypothetical protein